MRLSTDDGVSAFCSQFHSLLLAPDSLGLLQPPAAAAAASIAEPASILSVCLPLGLRNTPFKPWPTRARVDSAELNMEDWGGSSGGDGSGSGSSGGGSSDGGSDKEGVGLIVGTCERQQQQAGSLDSIHSAERRNAERLLAVTNLHGCPKLQQGG
jgi:hypothetical protein